MAQKQTDENDITAEALNRPITAEQYAGKRALIPQGDYSPVTVNVSRVKKFVDEQTGEVTEKIYMNYVCPNYDGDLSASHKISWHIKAPFGRLIRACFPGMKEEQLRKTPPKLSDLNGKVVRMVVDYDEVNGTRFNDFRFFALDTAKK